MSDNVCIFCGQKINIFQKSIVVCAGVSQTACTSCEKELEGLGEAEVCRRALIRGLAENPGRIEARIDLITTAEDHRPKCLSCGEKLIFIEEQELDNSPLRDSIFKDTFHVQPAYCIACGKYEFYNPAVFRKNKYLYYLACKDTRE